MGGGWYQTKRTDLGNGVTNYSVKSRRFWGPYHPPGDARYFWYFIGGLFLVSWPWAFHTFAVQIAVAIPWYMFLILVLSAVLGNKGKPGGQVQGKTDADTKPKEPPQPDRPGHAWGK